MLNVSTLTCILGGGLTALRVFFNSVRLATCRILVNVNVSHGAFYNAIPLNKLIQEYEAAHPPDRAELKSFLKRVRVAVIHLSEKINQARESIPRVKTIFELATKNDGRRLTHPLRVQKLDAGPKDAESFHGMSPQERPGSSTDQAPEKGETQSKGKGKEVDTSSTDPVQTVSQGGYISVYDYFKTGTYFFAAQHHSLVTM